MTKHYLLPATHLASNTNYRGQTNIAFIGYSWGGGAVYRLSELLEKDRGNYQPFRIRYTAYIDAIVLGDISA